MIYICEEKRPEIQLPEISMEIVRIRAALPVEIARISRINERVALQIIRDWGEGNKSLRALWDDVCNFIDTEDRGHLNK